MHICLLTDVYPAGACDDRESIYITELASGLEALGQEVTVICSQAKTTAGAGKIRIVLASPPKHLGELNLTSRTMPGSVRQAQSLLSYWHAFSETGGAKSFDVVETIERLSSSLLSAFSRQTPTVLRVNVRQKEPPDSFDMRFEEVISDFASACVDVFSCDSQRTAAAIEQSRKDQKAVTVNFSKDQRELASGALAIYKTAIERFATEKKPHLYRHGADRLIKSTEDMILLYEKMLYDLLFRVSYKFRLSHWLRKLKTNPQSLIARIRERFSPGA